MKVKWIRIWLSLNVNGKSHSKTIEQKYAEPLAQEDITDEVIIGIAREIGKVEVAHAVRRINNFISHEVKFADDVFLEARYNLELDPEKLSAGEVSDLLGAIYGIQTQRIKSSEVSWEVGEDETEQTIADPAAFAFPEKMLAFLEKPANLFFSITGADDAPEMVELRSATQLKLIELEFEATDEHIRISDKNLLADPNANNPSKCYKATAIDLVRENDLYSSEGLLIWIPELKMFGAYDEEHRNLVVFPNATPAKIQKDLGTYLQAQWSYGKDYVVKAGNIYDYCEPWKHFRFE